jgi:hypothetical protein
MINGCFRHLSQWVDWVVHIAVAQQEGSESTLKSLDSLVDVQGLQTMKSEAQKDCCCL